MIALLVADSVVNIPQLGRTAAGDLCAGSPRLACNWSPSARRSWHRCAANSRPRQRSYPTSAPHTGQPDLPGAIQRRLTRSVGDTPTSSGDLVGIPFAEPETAVRPCRDAERDAARGGNGGSVTLPDG